MALETYRAKRNFGVTPEPRGKVGKRTAALSFVVQKHAASHLHYDFRLELDGVLLSWAVPKGPSLDPADRRLAMHVEDHPLDYGGFEGTIPAGQYGGGTVMVWDRGTWEPDGDPRAGYAKGHLRFVLHGAKLTGRWSLVRTHASKYGGKTGDKAWLLIKGDDAGARSGGAGIVATAPDSVASGRTVEEIAQGGARIWRSDLSAAENVRAGAVARAAPRRGAPAKTSAPRAAKSAPAAKSRSAPAARSSPKRPPAAALPAGARRAALPATLRPMLATLVATPPAGDDWIHEIKYDGYRMLARIDRGRCTLFSRNGRDWTAALPGVARDLAALPVRQAWIDGELVVLDAHGRSRFQLLQNALSATPAATVALVAFDLPYVDGVDLRRATLTDRKARLREVVGNGAGCVRVGPEVAGSGEEFFRQSCSLQLEGAIAKRAGSHYADGTRTRDWVKVKCTKRQEMVIGGYTAPQGARSGFGALLLGVYEGATLRYSGKVGTGFDAATLTRLHTRLRSLERVTPPFANPPRGFAARGAHWVTPELVAEVSFTEWSEDGALRHPSFLGLRTDKPARSVVREEAMAETPVAKPKPAARRRADAAPAAPRGATRSGNAGANATQVGGIALSHPDKRYFPEAGLTKADIAQYYFDVAAQLLPHVRDRPLSLVRCPDGWGGQCFYQKHADPSVDPAVARIPVLESSGAAVYMSAPSAQALVALVQWGVIELHPWGARRPKLDRPDRLIFDFDPDERVAWPVLVEAVGLLRTMLDRFGLRGFLKTTGGKGLHVVVPIRATLNWAQAKSFSKAVATFLAKTFPDRFTATLAKARRRDRIFIDYLRNAEGATAVAPYAVRARRNAPVAMPIEWNELGTDVRFDHFNVGNARERIARVRDPWTEFAATRQSITKAIAAELGLAW